MPAPRRIMMQESGTSRVAVDLQGLLYLSRKLKNVLARLRG